MKRLLILFAVLLLSGCAAPEQSKSPDTTPVTSETPDTPDKPPEVSVTPVFKAEYIKLTPQEAEAMMSDDVVILDVRTQEEYDDGHIENAVLLPDYEVSAKAESVIPDKEQTILVYCRTGRRSEVAARTLIELGYTKVYDFGGIVDWTGTIVMTIIC